MTGTRLFNTSECEFFDKEGAASMEAPNYCMVYNNKCKLNKNCYYKQLKRKELECKKQKQLVKLSNSQIEFVKLDLGLKFSEVVRNVNSLAEDYKKIDKQRDFWREKAEKLQQALCEIEKLIPKFDSSSECDYGDFDCENCSSLDEEIVCSYKLKKIIQDIISKSREGKQWQNQKEN